jgi:uncharacterized protein (TIGR04552 family)
MPSVETIHPNAGALPLGRLGRREIDEVRLLLRGSSVVDWFRLHFEGREDARAFLRLNELDPARAADRGRLDDLRLRSIEYLGGHLRYRVPDEVRQASIEDLFDLASGKGRRSHRLYACLILKVMHILHHVEAHELLSMLPMSNAEVGILLHAKIERVVRGLMERQFPLVHFAGNAKTLDSTISKLLAKKDTQATQVFDRLRFRLVVERREDVPSLLLALLREVVPFNYLVPSQAENTLIDVDQMLVRAGNLAALRSAQQGSTLNEEEAPEPIARPRNEFSGPQFRVVNFVAQVPIRVDRVMPVQSRRLMGLGPVVFGTVEFQVMDRSTAERNESGPNRHALYKQRQRVRVRERLERGKRRRKPGPPS